MEEIKGKLYCEKRHGCVYGQCPWNLSGVKVGKSAPNDYHTERVKHGWAILPGNVYEAQECNRYRDL